MQDNPVSQTLINWTAAAFGALLSLLVAVLAFVGKSYMGKIDKLQQDVAETREKQVTREELAEYIQRVELARANMHRENLEAARETRGSVERVHERIDKLFEKNS